MAPWQLPTLLQCLDQLQSSIPRSTAVAVVLGALLVGIALGVWWRGRHGTGRDVLVPITPPTGKVPAPREWPAPLKPSVFAGQWWTSCHKHRRAYLISEGCAECQREAGKS